MGLALVAKGVFDAFYEKGLHSWDVAAGMLIVREAGGVVLSMDGASDCDVMGRQVLAACNKQLAARMGKVLSSLPEAS